MARNRNAADLDADMEMALQEALENDLVNDEADVDLDNELSLDEFEEQVSKAADALSAGNAESKAPGTPPDGAGGATKEPAAPTPALQAPIAAAATKPVFHAANDDNAEREYAQLLERINAAPSGRPVLWASLFGLAWLGGAAALAHVLYAPDVWQIRAIEQLRALPGAIAIAVGTIVPVFVFLGFGIMVRRASEMRNSARSMSEIAFRLAAPEKVAHDRVAMVGQAVRREVAAMGEGIERTIARATELEALMQNEVN